MKKIPLTQGKFALVDDEDFEELSKYKWFARKDKNMFYGSTQNKNGKTINMHRLIMKTPKGWVTDHIDRNGLNNQKQNLRICTNQQNIRNTIHYRNNKLGVKGVHFRWNKYIAQISTGGKVKYLGIFDKIEDAQKAYAAASGGR